MNKKIVKILKLGQESLADLEYWRSRPTEERIEAVETLRKEYYGISARLQRNVQVIKSPQR